MGIVYPDFTTISKLNVNIAQIEITTYHNFFMSQVTNLGKELAKPKEGSTKKEVEDFLSNEFKNADYFKGEKAITYNSIFIDEIQDYEKEWIEIVQNYFLIPKGEMVLFADLAQNIYQRDESVLNEKLPSKSIVKGFGRWGKLTKTYRSSIDTMLITSFKHFQERFLVTRHSDLQVFDIMLRPTLPGLEILGYHLYVEGGEVDEISLTIDEYIKQNKLIPNNIAIISSKINILKRTNDFFEKREKNNDNVCHNKRRRENF